MKTKAEIRSYIKQILLQNKQNLGDQSKAICKKILESDVYKNCDYVFSYMALWDEVDLSLVAKDCSGKKMLAIPKVHIQSMTMDYYLYEGKSEETQKGFCNIEEPVLEKKITFEELKDKKVLVLVPGRAFTKQGFRLGRGKGFYDKYLSGLTESLDRKNLFFWGIGFECQLLEEIPVEEHDIQLDRVL